MFLCNVTVQGLLSENGTWGGGGGGGKVIFF